MRFGGFRYSRFGGGFDFARVHRAAQSASSLNELKELQRDAHSVNPICWKEH